MGHIHTIPVDPSQTLIEAWRELCIFSRRITCTGPSTWAVVNCDGEECVNIDRLNAHVYFNDSLVSGPEGCTCKECDAQRSSISSEIN